jgi:hypothetical protein
VRVFSTKEANSSSFQISEARAAMPIWTYIAELCYDKARK